ncbi:MAG: hypothetical protein IK121_01560, partial [Lachnospiraceae bacterium]|nr:hypothetical protein [Lachnospiraceae bacterium]
NGKEDIAWYVLDKEAKNLILISMDVLDVMEYSSDKNTSWAQSNIRKWLNDDFLNEAFSEGERNKMQDKDLPNDDGVHSLDYAYLLSKEEAYSYFGIGEDILFQNFDSYEKKCAYLLNSVDERIYAKPTAYAINKGAYEWTKKNTERMQQFNGVDVSKAEGNTNWWLRSFTKEGDTAFYIESMGSVDSNIYVDSKMGIRPVIIVKP